MDYSRIHGRRPKTPRNTRILLSKILSTIFAPLDEAVIPGTMSNIKAIATICPTWKRLSYLLLFQQDSIRLSEYTIQPTLIVELIRAFGFRDIPGKEPDRPRAQLGKVKVHFRY